MSDDGGRCPCCGCDLIGNGQAAAMLGVTKGRIVQLVRAGLLLAHPFRAGTRTMYLIDKGSVEARQRAQARA